MVVHHNRLKPYVQRPPQLTENGSKQLHRPDELELMEEEEGGTQPVEEVGTGFGSTDPLGDDDADDDDDDDGIENAGPLQDRPAVQDPGGEAPALPVPRFALRNRANIVSPARLINEI